MVPSARRLGSHSRTNVGMPGCMIAMPNPDTIAAAYSVQTSMAAARAVMPSADWRALVRAYPRLLDKTLIDGR